MIVEKFSCDMCGCVMNEPWTYLYTHGDVYWGSRASVHFCKDCSRKLLDWIHENSVKGEEK